MSAAQFRSPRHVAVTNAQFFHPTSWEKRMERVGAAPADRWKVTVNSLPTRDLTTSAEWLAALRGIAGLEKSERPRVPFAATADQIRMAIQAEHRRPVRLLLAAMWLCCGRTGDCRLLTPGDLTRPKDTLRYRDIAQGPGQLSECANCCAPRPLTLTTSARDDFQQSGDER